MAGSTLNHSVTVGVTLGSAGYPSPLTITAAGAIDPAAYSATALVATLSAGYVLNQGAITGGTGRAGNPSTPVVTPGGTGGDGVDMSSGSVTNEGIIDGGAGGPAFVEYFANGVGGTGGTGLYVTNGMVTNSGTIAGGNGADGARGGGGGGGGTGISLDAGSNLLNTGLITGGTAGFVTGLFGRFYGAGGAGADVTNSTLTNHGTILAGASGFDGEGRAGVNLTNGVLTNDGSIGGAYGDAYAAPGVAIAGGMLTNNGTITGGFGGYGGPGVAVASGSVSNSGAIIGGSGFDGTAGVQFAAGGTLTNAGFIGGGVDSIGSGNGDAVEFGTAASRLILDPGASFSGSVVADAAFRNVLELADPPSFGEIIGLGDTILGFGTIEFDANASWLLGGNTAGLAAGQTIDGFHLGDTIEVTGFVETGHSYTSDGLVLTGTGSSETIGIRGAFTTADFDVFSSGGNSFAELQPVCFAAGTRIATDCGEVPVEALTVGDQVFALLGNALAPVIWIGRRTVDCARHPKPAQAWPVRIRAGAFGRGRPRRDLFLSPNHAVYVGEVLIPVKRLINGTSIAQLPIDEVTYCHIELPRHDVVLAEGLPAESFLDMRDGSNYANRPGPIRRYSDYAARMWEAFGCARLIVTGPELAAARALVESFAKMRAAA